MSSHPRHIPSLDGLRALSFLLVFVAHAGLERFVPGGFGVTIFFFLSGYLITTLMRTEWEKNGSINFGHFWMRRALRILPPFYLVLTAATALTIWLQGAAAVSLASVGAQALHYSNYWIIYHGYDGIPAGTGVYWSLAVEEHFYVVFPWVYYGLKKAHAAPRTQAIFFWSLCGVVLLWRCYLVMGLQVSEDRTYMASDTRVDSILFGCALAVWHNPVLDRTALDASRWKYAYLPLALLVLAGCVAMRGELFRETVRYTLQGLALTVVFIAAIRFSHWRVFALLNVRLAAFIGLLSYSLYLLHYAVLAAFQYRLPWIAPLPRAVLALSLSLGLAWLIYLGVEKPCARLRKRLAD